jgi:beta-lactam-binding protein with PASTA domain
VVLKALAKNPENRYQTAAEMRADLVRVHNGEVPEAPKVLTGAERSSLLASPAGHSEITDELPKQKPHYVSTGDHRDGRGSVARWLVAVAVLAVLTVVVTIAINVFGGNTRDVQVPDVAGQASADAIAALQNRGFKTRTLQKPDSTVPPDHVINTDPAANASIGAGDEITLNVSTGPEQREVPDVATLSYADAVQKLKSAGFTRFKQTTSTSTPELKDKAIGTNPPANQTSAITNEITVIVGAGPETKPLPDVGGLSVGLATTNLKANGFDPTKITQRPVDSTQPAGEVINTKPAAGSVVPLDSVVELQVSQGNQFVMPDLTGQFWVDAEPRLRALGWTGVLDRGADVSNSGQRTNAVVTQSPAAGTGVTFSSRITLSFAS